MQTGSNSHHKTELALALIFLSAIVTILFQSCQKPVEIPARMIVGSYTSGRPVYFADQSDSCTLTYDVYDSTGITMRWEISYYMDNLVSVLVSASSTDTTIKVADVCELGYQYTLPMTLRGVVGGSTIVLERSYIYSDTVGKPHTAYSELGSFDFSSTSISGKFVDLQCDTVHCYGYRTRSFLMNKQ